MRAADTLLGGERDVIARFQRFLRGLYAYRELLTFSECFIGHDVNKARTDNPCGPSSYKT